MCVPAPACRAALKEATERWPGRSSASDGICASPDHLKRAPVSDHNDGNAYDLTHNPGAGVDCHRIADLLVNRRDQRVLYVIWSKRIARSYPKPGIPAWTWAPYTGANPHTKHLHVSIKKEARNDVAPWFAPSSQQEDDMFRPEDSDALQEALRLLRAITPTVLDDKQTGHVSNLTKTLTEVRAVRALVSSGSDDIDVAALATALREDLGDQIADELAERLRS